MPYIKIEDFSGVVPRTGATQLAANQAQVANNVKLQSKELRSWAEPTLAYVPSNPSPQTVYRIDSSSGDKYWCEWNTEVDMVPGPVADVSEFRYYYTGDGLPKKTNSALATTNNTGIKPFPNAWLYMGVPNPTAAPSLAPSNTSGTTETRAYVYTNVSTFGSVKEESGPSPATTVTVTNTGASVTVSGFSAAPTTGYNITHRRIYRTIAGASTVTYSFVAEIPVWSGSYVDSLSVAQLGSELPSLYFEEPPTDLKGLVGMPNGILAGFKGNQVWFSEPYYPHAWPSGYMLTVDDPIVGLGVYQTTLVVLTTRNPYLISGVSPTSMSQQKLPLPQPCVSKKSIASDQYGVMYASPNGLVSISSGSYDVVTTPLYTRDEWQALNPSTMKGLIYNNMYLGFYTSNDGSRAIVLSRGDIPPLVNLDFNAVSTFVDRSSAAIYAISGVDNKVYELDSSTINYTTFDWISKKFVMPNPINFGAMKVQADYDFMGSIEAYNAYRAELIAENQVLFTSLGGKVGGVVNNEAVNTLAVNGSKLYDIPEAGNYRSVNVVVYADGETIFATYAKSQEPIRMPALKKGYVYEIRITGNTPVRSLIMASSIGELRNVAP